MRVTVKTLKVGRLLCKNVIMTLTSDVFDSDKKHKRKKSGRKRKKSKPSLNSDKGFLKKIKQSDIDTESEPDLFLDAQDKLPSSKPYHCNSDNESELDQQPDNSYIPDIHNISLPASDSGSETCLKSVLEPGIMESPSSTPTQLSQSLLDGAGMGGPAYGPPPE